jgi:hypothetical protein
MVVLAVVLGFYLWPGAGTPKQSTTSEVHLPFGPAEQAYAEKIQIENVSMSRAENFIHQEVTTVSGEMVNAGSLPLRDVELTIVFSDELQEVVLRESRLLFGSGSGPLGPGGRREFAISLEHIPSSWNRQVPLLTINGLQFAAHK